MQYLGSKRRIKKYIIDILHKNLHPDDIFLDMFVGGANIIDKVNHPYRVGNDLHFPLIQMWKKLRDGWIPPKYVSKEKYKEAKNSGNIKPHLKAYIGFCSFGAKYFDGYPNSNSDGTRTSLDYWGQHYRFVMSQVPYIQGVKFTNYSYKTFPLHKINKRFVIYCDKPYEATASYSIYTIGKTKIKFNHKQFWMWTREVVKKGHLVFVSEYNAPDDFICIWEKELTVQADAKSNKNKKTEKVFIHKSQADLIQY